MPPKKGPDSRGLGITSGLINPVKMQTGGDAGIAQKYRQSYEELLPITREIAPSPGFYERAGMSPFKFFAALASPQAPGQSLLGKIAEAGQYLDIKPDPKLAEQMASELSLQQALKDTTKDPIKLGKDERLLVPDATTESGYKILDMPGGDQNEIDDLGLTGDAKNLYLIEKNLEANNITQEEAEQLKNSILSKDKQILTVEEELAKSLQEATLAQVSSDVEKAQTKIAEDAASASKMKSDLLKQKVLLEDSITGSFQDTRENLDKFLQTFGLDQTAPELYSLIQNSFIQGDLSQTQLIEALQKFATISKAELLPSNLNQTEIELLIGAGAQTYMTKEGQELIIESNLFDQEVKEYKNDAYNDFLNTGKLVGMNGEVLYDAEIEEGATVDLQKRDAALRELSKYETALYNNFVDEQRSKIDKIASYGPILTNSQISDLPDNKKILEYQGETYNLAKESKNGNLNFVGFSGDDGKFIYEGKEYISPKPNQPMYALYYGDGTNFAVIDLDQ